MKFHTKEEWDRLAQLNKDFLDTLDLPVPKYGEDVRDYLDRIEPMFADVEFPEELHGCLNDHLDLAELGEYLVNRFHDILSCCEEEVEVRYILY